MGTHELILGAGLVIILSYFFNLIAQRTNVPSVLLLMVLGFGLKNLVSIEPDDQLFALNILGTVGVILIVLEASLDLELAASKWPIIWRSLVLATGLLILTTGLVSLVLIALLQLDFFTSLLYAVPLSVMSSAIIIPSVHRLGEHKKEFLIYESAFSDIIGIILFYALITFHEAEPGSNVALQITGNFFLTLIVSFIISYFLIALFQYVSGHVRLFLLIAVLVSLYSVGKLLHQSSLVMILIFGLLLNNKSVFFRGKLSGLIKADKFDDIVRNFKVITLESAFVVRTFFFVAFGMSIVLGQLLHWTVPVISLLVLLAIYLSRWAGLRLFMGKDINPELYVAPRGLITILLFYAIPTELQTEAFEPGILLLTILISSVIMTYGLIQYARTHPSAPIVQTSAPAVSTEQAEPLVQSPTDSSAIQPPTQDNPGDNT